MARTGFRHNNEYVYECHILPCSNWFLSTHIHWRRTRNLEALNTRKTQNTTYLLNLLDSLGCACFPPHWSCGSCKYWSHLFCMTMSHVVVTSLTTLKLNIDGSTFRMSVAVLMNTSPCVPPQYLGPWPSVKRSSCSCVGSSSHSPMLRLYAIHTANLYLWVRHNWSNAPTAKWT